MGIDIYAKWRNQTAKESVAQSEAWQEAAQGKIGYLREAYHGKPYATRYMCAEAFDAENGEAQIPAATLRARLDKTLELAAERERTVYQSSEEETEEVVQSYRDFVALCEQKEDETGEPVLIIASY